LARFAIFLSFIPVVLIEEILNDIKNESEDPWLLYHETRQRADGTTYCQPKHCHVDAAAVLKVLALQIWIYGRQKSPKENNTSYGGSKKVAKSAEERKRVKTYHLREAFKDAGDYITARIEKEYGQVVNVPNHKVIEKIHQKFHLWGKYASTISDNFQGALQHLGRYIAGDEKLFKFKGYSGFVRMCPNKPDKVGIWWYQLCARLPNGQPVLIYYRLHDSNTVVDQEDTDEFGIDLGPGLKSGHSDQCITTASIVKDWGNIIIDFGDLNVMLAFDSYYLSAQGRAWLQKKEVKYIASVEPSRFKKLHNLVKGNITQSGDWAAVYRPATKELFTYVWDMRKEIGKKCNLSNCFDLTVRASNHGRDLSSSTLIIPGYDAYDLMFFLCDVFNRNLHDRKFPHKPGSDYASMHDFTMSVTLQNVLNIFCYLHPEIPSTETFETHCYTLATELFKFACDYAKVL
jgi:hypothetical protein